MAPIWKLTFVPQISCATQSFSFRLSLTYSPAFRTIHKDKEITLVFQTLFTFIHSERDQSVFYSKQIAFFHGLIDFSTVNICLLSRPVTGLGQARQKTFQFKIGVKLWFCSVWGRRLKHSSLRNQDLFL